MHFLTVNLKSINLSQNVSSIGTNAFENCYSLNNVTFAENSNLTEFKNYLFKNCTSLQQINIPKNLTTIGEAPFYNCTNLQTFSISTGNNNFQTDTNKNILIYIYTDNNITLKNIVCYAQNTQYTSYTIPSDIDSINMYAFSFCKNLQNVTIGSSKLNSVGQYTFYNCTSLKDIRLSSNINTINDYAFYNCKNLITISFVNSSSITSIGSYAFANCTSLTSLPLFNSSNAAITISGHAFINCTGLLNININNNNNIGTVSIGSYAFQNCSKLVNINKGEYITNIGAYAFADCISFTTISLTQNFILISQLQDIGDYAFYNCISLISCFIPSNIPNDKVGTNIFQNCIKLQNFYILNTNIIKIPDYTFNNCKKLQYINIIKTSPPPQLITQKLPANITTIGKYAFKNCSSLTELSFENNSILNLIDEGAFYGCSNLSNFSLPSPVYNQGNMIKISINDYAFQDCISLTSFTITENINSPIGNNVFKNCIGIQNFIISNNNNYNYDNGALINSNKLKQFALNYNPVGGNGKYTIPNTITSIDKYAFANCQHLTEIDLTYLSNNITVIPIYTFAFCTSLQTITIPDTITEIGGSAFLGCSNLKNINFGQNSELKTISDYSVFQGCNSLETIHIPPKVSYISSDTFVDCYKLKTFMVDNNSNFNTITGTELIKNNILFFYAQNSSNTSYTIPNGITHISKYAFRNANNLKSISIPDSIIYIDEYSFDSCYNLTEINISINSNLRIINNYAFKDCKNIKKFTIPQNLIYIGQNAFDGCVNLTEVDFTNANNLIYIDQYAFKDCVSLININLKSAINLSTINDGAFSNSIFTKIDIPQNLITIGQNVFPYVIYEILNNNNNNFYIDNNNSGYVLYNTFSLIKSSIYISGIYTILNGHINNNIVISIQAILENAFILCGKLTGINYDLSVNLSYFYDGIFKGTSITEIKIPQSLISMGQACYFGCNINNIINNNSDNFYIDYTNYSENISLKPMVLYYTNGNGITINVIKAINYNNITRYEMRDLYQIFPNNPNAFNINSGAFHNLNNLEEIIFNFALSNKIQNIYNSAFLNCRNLKNFNFINLVNLKIIDIEAFRNCTSFGNVNLSYCNSLERIDDNAFLNCSIKNLFIPKSNLKLGANPFAKCPLDNIININNNYYVHNSNNGYILYGNNNLISTSNNISGVYQVLKGNVNTNDIYLAIQYIHYLNFYNLPNLINLDLTNTKPFTIINSYVCYNCGITQLDIPDSIWSIETGAFTRCPLNLISNNSPYFYLDIQQNSYILYNNNTILLATTNISGSYTILSGTKSSNNKFITLDIQNINDNCFYDCIDLTSINLSQVNLKIIGYNAFKNCSNLNLFELPEDVLIISDGAFSNMTKLELIAFYGKPPLIIGTNFYLKNNLSINIENSDLLNGNIFLSDILSEILNNFNQTQLDSIKNKLIFFVSNNNVEILNYIYYSFTTNNNIFIGDENLKTIGYSSNYSFYWYPPMPLWIPESVTTFGPFGPDICFNKGTKILCLNENNIEEYINIENLDINNNLVKTYKHGYRKIHKIGHCLFKNNKYSNNINNLNNIKNIHKIKPILDNININNLRKSMFKMPKNDDMIDDLIVTGGHSILVDSEKYNEINKINKINNVEKIDDKYLILACQSSSFKKIEDNKFYEIYHLALKSDVDDSISDSISDIRYGIWANGVLTESTYKKNILKML